MTLQEAKALTCACIYKITFPNGKSYIGETKNLHSRIGIYERFYNDGKNTYVSTAINEYGLDSAEWEVLKEVNGFEGDDLSIVLSILEIKYIRDHNTIYPNGYNKSIGGEILGIPSDCISTESYRSSGKKVLVYDIDGNFLKEFDSIGKCSYDYNIDEEIIRKNIDKRKCCFGKYIFKTKKYNYIPQKIDVSGIKVVERVKYKTVIVPKYVEKEINIGHPNKTLLYDENGDFVGEFNSKNEATRTFSKAHSIPYGVYKDGYIMYKKVNDDFPKKIEPYVDTLGFALGEVYKPMSECERVYVKEKKSPYVRKGCGKHKNLINNFRVKQFNDEGFEQIYENIRDASEETGIKYSNIWACIFGRTKKSGGFYWKKIEE